MTTRKHFVAAAETVSKIPRRGKRLVEAVKFIKIFRKENPRFDKARFLEACGL